MENIGIENVVFEIRNNVKSQSCNISNSDLFFEYHHHDNTHYDKSKINMFFLFESCMHAAFGHWIYESAIYLTYFSKLKSKYPELHIVVNKNPKRTYKTLFFKALGIDENDIYWLDNKEINDCKTVYANIPGNNICINTRPHYLNTIHVKNKLVFKELIQKFKDIIIANLNIIYPNEKTIEHLFFPRSKTENFICNDRVINYEKVYKLLKGKPYTEYDTMNTIQLKDQINLLTLSKNIYLDWGSSSMVNCLFCKNNNIYLSMCLVGQLKYEGVDIIYKFHKETNHITHL